MVYLEAFLTTLIELGLLVVLNMLALLMGMYLALSSLLVRCNVGLRRGVVDCTFRRELCLETIYH